MLPLTRDLPQIYRAVDTSHRLEKIAEYYADDPEVAASAQLAKVAVDAEVFHLIKNAAAPAAASPLLKKLMTGAAYGAGAAVPITAGGAYLLGKARDDAQSTAADIRNKVLQTGLGLAGIGGAMYGLHRLAEGSPKQASDDEGAVEELIEKLATVEVIEEMFSRLDPSKLSPEAQKLAFDMAALNRGYGVQLLYEAANA